MDDTTANAVHSYGLQKSLQIPAPVTCLDLADDGLLVGSGIMPFCLCHKLFIPSDDGTLRIYSMTTFTVTKAIRGLEAEVSSVRTVRRPQSAGTFDIWLACGRKLFSFRDEPEQRLILAASDANFVTDLVEADDVLNELSMNASQGHLAFSSDNGIVGVIELGSMEVTIMRKKHQSICASVQFIPDRSRELVSGGYDCALIHFDYVQGTILSRHEIPTPLASGMSLSPPFVMCMAISQSGLLAACTADGRCFFGVGGERRATSSNKSKKKRTRKWNGLEESTSLLEKIAEGPIVAMQFSDSETLIVSTLLGNMTKLCCNTRDGGVTLVERWRGKTKDIEKVNALAVDANRIVVGGLSSHGKGIIEVWNATV